MTRPVEKLIERFDECREDAINCGSPIKITDVLYQEIRGHLARVAELEKDYEQLKQTAGHLSCQHDHWKAEAEASKRDAGRLDFIERMYFEKYAPYGDRDDVRWNTVNDPFGQLCGSTLREAIDNLTTDAKGGA